MPLPKKLFAQVVDFAKMRGRKMQPEQTERALHKLRHMPDPVLSGKGGSGWNEREDFISELKQSKILQDPDVERAYAFGSSVTEKVDPTDLDLILRGKNKAADLRIQDKYSSIAPQHEFKDLHVTSSDPTIEFPHKAGWRSEDVTAAKTAGNIARVGAEKYGDKHKWIRLVGIPFASSLGLLSEGEVEEVHAGVASWARKLLNTPVTRRGFVQDASEAVKDLKMLKRPTAKNPAVIDTFTVEHLLTHKGAHNYMDGEIAFLPSPYEGATLEDMAAASRDLLYLSGTEQKIATVLNSFDPVKANDYILYKTLKNSNMTPKQIFDYQRLAQRFGPGTEKAKVAAEEMPHLKQGLKDLGIDVSRLNRFKIPESPIKELEKAAFEHLKTLGKEGAKIAESLGDIPVTRRQLFGLGRKSLLSAGTAVAAGSVASPEEAAAIPKAEALKNLLPVIERASTGLMHKAGQAVTPIPEHYSLMNKANRLERTGKQLERIPEKEFDRITDLRYGSSAFTEGVGATAGRFNTKRRDITLFLNDVNPATPWHEIVHARQTQNKPLWDYMLKLKEHVEKWIQDPYERYMNYAHEFHATSLADEMAYGHGPVTQSEYDAIYRRSLKDAVQYVETFLKAQDPTFKGKLVKSIAIGSAIGTALAMDVALPEDANAMPRGVYEMIKNSAKVYEKSSGAANLIGKELKPGKVISDVVKKNKYDRAIRFTDGTEMNVTTHEITDLNRTFGTKKYIEKFQDKDIPSKTTQALKSLSMHESRATSIPKSLHRQYIDKHLMRLGEIGEDLNPDIVFVSRGEKIFTMPRAYAELLEQINMVEIVKTKKYLDIIKRHQVK